ncbi:MAG: MerR family transcriptional regulator [Chloroflexi bacterium]|nr:MerR family transcriptional regulator [Chloroflexota bacterium]
MEEELTIQEVAARTGLSVHTLRYYERIGLLSAVSRATSGHRRYTADDLTWITFLQCLRATGMSIQQMLAFAELRRQGDPGVPGRLAFLEAHQQQLLEHMRELEGYLAVIEKKIQRYRIILADEKKDTTPGQVPTSPHFSLTTQRKEESVPFYGTH